MKNLAKLTTALIAVLSSAQLASAQCCLPTISNPAGGTTVTIVAYPGWPAVPFSTVSITLANAVGPLAAITYPGWCVDGSAEINPGLFPGTPYTGAIFYSTCDLAALNANLVYQNHVLATTPDHDVSALDWRKIAYILNHRQGYSFLEVQCAIRNFISAAFTPNPALYPGVPFSTANVTALTTAANNLGTWQPGCGDKVPVVMILPDDPTTGLGRQILILEADCTCPPTQVGPGTGTPGFWKNHPEAWPVLSITIGGTTYTKAQAITIMGTPDAGDKRYTMFRDICCAKLNILVGNAHSCIDATLALADTWWATYKGSPVPGRSAAWTLGEPWATTLDNYNNGLLCAPHRNP